MVDQISEDIDRHLRALSLGLVQNSGEQIYRAHRELYNLGQNVLPVLEEQILSQSWSEIRHGSQLNLLSGLLSLINDIDEGRAKEVGENIRKAGCSSIVDRRIASITAFTLNEFNNYEIRGLRIFQSKDLVESTRIKSKLEKWLAMVPKKDIDQIERIYIIPKSNEDYCGTYMPILCSIMVEWDLPVSYYNPLAWIYFLQIEKTLYHEIGHHFHRHTFGQDAEQEKEADRYAVQLLRQSHPILRGVVRTIRGIFGKRSNVGSRA
jgi:hypothetical protein